MFYILVGIEGTADVKSPRCSHQCLGFDTSLPTRRRGRGACELLEALRLCVRSGPFLALSRSLSWAWPGIRETPARKRWHSCGRHPARAGDMKRLDSAIHTSSRVRIARRVLGRLTNGALIDSYPGPCVGLAPGGLVNPS